MFAGLLFAIYYFILFLYFTRRPFDLFTFVFLTSILYFVPALFGVVSDGNYPIHLENISSGAYGFYVLFYISLTFASLFAGERSSGMEFDAIAQKADLTRSRLVLDQMVLTLRVITPISLVISYLIMGNVFFSEDKGAFLQDQSAWYSIWQLLTYFYCVLAVIARKRVDVLLSISFCCLDLYIGFRGASVFAVMCIYCYYAIHSRKSNRYCYGFAVAAFVAFGLSVIYKAIIYFLKLGDIELVLDKIGDFEGLFESLFLSEGFVTQAIFSTVVAADYSIPWTQVFEVLRVFLPVIHVQLFGAPKGFNDFFQDALFSNNQWGMASNIWAEQFAMFGWVGLIMFLVAFLLFVRAANGVIIREIGRGHTTVGILAILVVAPALVFMHRNDFAFQLVLIRNSLFLAGFLFYLVGGFSKRYSVKESA